MSKNVPKCQNVSWGDFFEKVFLLSVPWSHRKFAKKSKKIQNCKKAQNRFQNCPYLFWTCFAAIFFEKNCPVLHGGSGLPKISKKWKKFRNSKSAQNRSQKCPNVFWTCLGQYFRIFFCPGVPAGHFRLSTSFPTQKSTDVLFALTPQSVYAIPFQIFWT